MARGGRQARDCRCCRCCLAAAAARAAAAAVCLYFSWQTKPTNQQSVLLKVQVLFEEMKKLMKYEVTADDFPVKVRGGHPPLLLLAAALVGGRPRSSCWPMLAHAGPCVAVRCGCCSGLPISESAGTTEQGRWQRRVGGSGGAFPRSASLTPPPPPSCRCPGPAADFVRRGGEAVRANGEEPHDYCQHNMTRRRQQTATAALPRLHAPWRARGCLPLSATLPAVLVTPTSRRFVDLPAKVSCFTRLGSACLGSARQDAN